MRFSFARHLTPLCLAGLAACAADGPADPPTWEEFRASATFVIDGQENYRVDGDEPVRDLAELREIYEKQVNRAPRSIVHVVDGHDDTWIGLAHFDLTYCVSNSFGSDKTTVVNNMADAVADWEAVARVNFRYVSAEDGSCDASNNDVVFDVRPWTENGADAFKPSYPRDQRTLWVNPDASFASAPDVKLVGILRHELGHTLGLRHEHIRVDNCKDEELDYRELTSYDQKSVMHYPWCSGDADSKLELTAKDIAGIRSLYGDSARPQYEKPKKVLDGYGHDDGWLVARHPRMLGDVNNDGRPDLFVFGDTGVFVNTGDGADFSSTPRFLDSFGYEQGGWRIEKHPRFVADVNADNRDDIVGFGNGGVYVSLATTSGFTQPEMWVDSYGYEEGGWRVEKHPRFVVDINRDGRADIIGMGEAGVYVSLSTGHSFTDPTLKLEFFGHEPSQGWEVSKHPRAIADMDGDGDPDIVGFANNGVWVAHGNGSGGFSAAKHLLDAFGADFDSGGWRVDKHPRLLADMNKDGRDDVVGFADNGVWVALSTSTGLGAAKHWVKEFGADFDAGGWDVENHPRFLADVNDDQRADVIGFAGDGVRVALSTGTDVAATRLWITGFGANFTAGLWLPEKNPRLVADLNKDGAADIVGFANKGVYISRTVLP